MGDSVTAKLGGGTNVSGFADSLVTALDDIDKTLQGLEKLIGYEEIDWQAEKLPTTPEPSNEMEDALNEFIVSMVGVKLRVRRLEQELIKVFNRLGLVTQQVRNANQK